MKVPSQIAEVVDWKKDLKLFQNFAFGYHVFKSAHEIEARRKADEFFETSPFKRC